MDFQELSDKVITGDAPGAASWTEAALAGGVEPRDIIDKGLIPGMDVVGARFKSGEYYMPEVLISARAMTASLELVRPLIAASDSEARGTIVIGTVLGDLHDIGKNLVRMMLEGAGFNVIDLGVDVSPDAFVKAIEETKADIVCMSALLTTTMDNMGSIIKAISEAELRGEVQVMIGGAPVSAAFAEKIGADGYAEDAATAVELAHRLIKV
ncbi:MAG: corrinoid protein [Chloroflexi bacterium]|nr:corrinoid protein [Chloroflexota bacterium]